MKKKVGFKSRWIAVRSMTSAQRFSRQSDNACCHRRAWDKWRLLVPGQKSQEIREVLPKNKSSGGDIKNASICADSIKNCMIIQRRNQLLHCAIAAYGVSARPAVVLNLSKTTACETHERRTDVVVRHGESCGCGSCGFRRVRTLEVARSHKRQLTR